MLSKENTKEQVAGDQSRLIRMQEDTLPSSSQQILKLPEGFTIGKAIEGGDCFFDAVAQGLKQLKPETNFTVKSLRKVCKKQALSDQEMREKVIKDARNSEDSTIKLPQSDINDDELWNAYLASIEYTAEDITEMKTQNLNLYKLLTSSKYGSTLQIPIWGRPEIEGSMICNEYNVKLHVIESNPWYTNDKQQEPFLHQLIDDSGLRNIGGYDKVDYNDGSILHIINGGYSHFEPILKKVVKQMLPYSSLTQTQNGSNKLSFTDNQMDCGTSVRISPAGSEIGAICSDYMEVQSDTKFNTSDAGIANDTVTKRAILFVKTFVGEFEEKSREYYEEAKPGSKIRKAGKVLDCLDSTQKGFTIPIVRGVTDKVSEGIAASAAREHRRKAKRFFASTVPFRNDMRKILVEASLEIFQKFGDQFMRVVDVDQSSWERGVEKLAIDAASRATNYISTIDRKEELPINLITKGVVLGQSKSKTLTKSMLKNSGYKVQDKQSGEIWLTSDLFRNIGIRKVNGDYVQHYTMKEHNCAEKYGYRFPFKWESEEWSNIYEYQQDHFLKKEECKYTLNEREKEGLAVSILREINGKNPLKVEEYLSMQDKKDISQYSFNFSSEKDFFCIEREEMYKELASHLYGQSKEEKMSRMVVITGDSGVGKSMLARRYGFYERFRCINTWVIWIDASSNTSLSEDFHELAIQLNIPTQGQKIKSIVKNIYKFVLDKKILFTFDNASSYKQIEQFLPSCFPKVFFNRERPFIIITSCNKNWTIKMEEEEEQKGKKSKVIEISKIELGTLKTTEIFQYVQESLKDELQNMNIQEVEVKDLVKTLNYIPSAVKQALGYIKNSNASIKMQEKKIISKYLKCFNKMIQESTDYLVVPNVSKELSIALEINLNEIEKKDIEQKAYDILSFMAYLNPNQINVEKFFLWNESGKNKQRVSSALNLLCKFSIIKLEGSIGKIDKEIQAVIRSKHKQKGTEEKFLEKIILSLECNYITDGHIVSIWNYISKYNKLVNKFINSNYAGHNILHLLAIDGNEEVIKLILEKIDSSQLSNIINASDKYGSTPFEYAIMYGHLELVKYFIKKEVDLKDDYTILHWAASCAQLEIVKYFFINNKNYDLNEFDGEGNTALACAIKNSDLDSTRYLDVIKCLVEKGADINKKEEDGNTPLHLAVENDCLNIVKYLVEQGADINMKEEDGNTPLHLAAENDHLDSVKYLISEGANVNLQNKNGMSALHLAAENDHLDSVKYLVSEGANVNLQNKNGMSALHLAAQKGHLKIVMYLIMQRADVNLKDKDGMSPVCYATIYDHFYVVKCLVKKKAKVNLQNKNDMSALHLAVLNNRISIAYYLMRYGANVDLKDEDGMSPLHHAAELGRLDIACCLMRYGANVNLQDKDDMSPLHHAAELGRLDIACRLMRYGANVNLQDEGGMSPIDCAVVNNHLDIACCLYEFRATVNPGYKNLFYRLPGINNYSYNLEPQLNFPHLGIQLHKNQQETSAYLSVSKKIKLENVSGTSEENTSNTQLIQGSQNTLPFNTKESLFKLKHKLDNCANAMQEEKINSQLENSYSQQLVNNMYGARV